MTNKLTERELWMLGEAFRVGRLGAYKNVTQWLDEHYQDDSLNRDVLAKEAPPPMTVERAREVLAKNVVTYIPNFEDQKQIDIFLMSTICRARIESHSDQQLTAYMVLRREVEG